jgi:HAD superfamily phosphatase (TIGR01668 family)
MLERFRPDIIVPRLELLDQDELWARGVRAVLLDRDNTLTVWGGKDIPPARREWVARAQERFSVCILSNTIKGGKLRRIGEDLRIPTVARWGLGRKPLPGGFRAAMAVTGTQPAETAMVGDQLLADVLGANLLGLTSVWVRPLDSHEFFTTQIMRRVERRIAARLGLEVPSGGAEETP